jgi:hypothetical protein
MTRARPPPPRGPRPWRAPAALLALVALLAAASLAAAGPIVDPLAAEAMLFYSDAPALIITSTAWTLIAPLTEKAFSGVPRAPLAAGPPPHPSSNVQFFFGGARHAPRAAPQTRPPLQPPANPPHPRPPPTTPHPLRQGRPVHHGQGPLHIPHTRAALGEAGALNLFRAGAARCAHGSAFALTFSTFGVDIL